MGYCKKDVTPLLTHWSYVFLALTHRHFEMHVDVKMLDCFVNCIWSLTSFRFYQFQLLWNYSSNLSKLCLVQTFPSCNAYVFLNGDMVDICGPVAPFTNFFARNSNLMETSFCCNCAAGHQIATNLCTCHDSKAVVSCTNFVSDHWEWNKVSVKFELRCTNLQRNGAQYDLTLYEDFVAKSMFVRQG